MNKTQEALKMAQDLRALADRFSEGWHEGIKINASDIVLLSDAADALAEQPAQQQEHVIDVRVWHDENHDQHAEFRGVHKLPDGRHVLYKSPPASKPWVGLTDDEFQWIYDNGRTPAGMIEMAEAKLKEKNA